MHRLGRIALPIFALAASSPVLRAEDEWRGNLWWALGARWLDDELLEEPRENPLAYGLCVDGRPPASGLGWEIGWFVSESSESNFVFLGQVITSRTTVVDFFAGARFTADLGRFHPYVGAGASLVYADIERIDGPSELRADDLGFGAYVRAGMYARTWDMGSVHKRQRRTRLTLGVDVRAILGTEIELGGVDGDVDHVQAAITIGVAL